MRLFFERAINAKKASEHALWHVYAKALGLPQDQWAVFGQIQIIDQACFETAQILEKDEGAKLIRDHSIRALNEIRGTLQIDSLTKQWQQVQSVYNAGILQTLQSIDTYLTAKSYVIEIDDEEIESIIQELDSIIAEISNLNTHPDVVELMLAHIEPLIFALRNHELYSVDGLWTISMTMLMEVYRPSAERTWATPDADEGETNLKSKIGEAGKKIMSFLEKTERFHRGANAIEGLTEKITNLLP